MKSKLLTTLAILTTISFTGFVSAKTDIQKTLDKFCDTMKKCTLMQMEGEEMPASMKDMIIQTIDSQCAVMFQMPDSAVETYADIIESADACIDSIAKDNCAMFDEELNTPECKEYEKKVNELEQG